ncbi:MAG TPA: RNA polymerase sporulation sigma factor SigK [Bacillota bacterium]|nr:RNA polymerase sporulation sigma factor SigK [Bacillota bacterium]
MFQLIYQLMTQIWFFFLRVTPGYSFPPVLSEKQELDCFVRMKNGDSAARVMLIEHNLRLVAHIVKKYYTNCPDRDDLISIGTIGLIKAIDTYDMDSGTRFATYAGKCLQNEILMHFRRQKKLLCETSINDPVDVDKDGNPLTYMDILSDDTDIACEIDIKIKNERAAKALNSVLTERERKIIVLRYGLGGSQRCDPYTQREVAKMMGISRSYVSRIEKTALKKLRQAIGN